jgi:hypothetical protein
MIGCITAGNVRAECCESIIALVATRTVSWVVFHRSGPYLDDARNELIRHFNREEFADCTHLLMVDSDIEFTPDDVRTLYEADLPVVTGIYHSQFPAGVLPIVYDWDVTEAGQKILLPITAWADAWPMWPERYDGPLDPVVDIQGCGGGFLMIRRDVLDALAEIHSEPLPWFAEEVYDTIHFGEDLTFCLRVRELGVNVAAHRGVQVAHHKMARIAL